MPISTQSKGLLLALTTAFFWGTLPIALKQLVTDVDPLTIVWLRFVTSALWLWLLLPAHRRTTAHGQQEGHRPGPSVYEWRVILLLALATLGLGGNFVLFNASVVHLPASASQIIAQSGAMLLMLGSVLVLRESFHRIQLLGVVVLLAGFALFFNERLLDLLQPGTGYGLGIMLGLLASVVWAAYGLAQKVLLRYMSPPRIMRVLYTGCALGFTPLASPGLFWNLDGLQLLCLAYCCLNTIVAYGAFSRAMSFWHTAKVGGIITLTPLFTLFFAYFFHALMPQVFPPSPVSWLNASGALVVVCGAGLIAVGPLLHWPGRKKQ